MIDKQNSPTQLEVNSLIEYFQNGHYDDAQRLAENITKKFPKYQFAWKVLGAIFAEKGIFENALIANEKAAQIDPKDPEAVHNLGITLKSLGKLDYAEDSFRKAIKIKSDYTEAYINLGVLLQELSQLKEAESVYKKAINIRPDFAITHNNLANILKELGRYDEAIIRFKQAILLQPDFFQAYNNLGITYKILGKLKLAESNYRKAISKNPNFAEAYENLAKILQDLGKHDEAEMNFKHAISINPKYANAHFNLGITLYKLRRLDESKNSYQAAVSLRPEFYEAHNNLGIIQRETGMFNEATASFNKAIELKPDFAEAHRNLCAIKKFNRQDSHFNQMNKLLTNKDLSDEDRCYINFALAKASEDLGDYSHAFNFYNYGNALKKKIIGYDLNRDKNIFNQLKASYPKIKKILNTSDIFSSEITPIFIVGMPRSGTTLIEQIISSHSQVSGAGELPFISYFGDGIARGLLNIDLKNLIDFRENYLLQLKTIFKDCQLVSDKMPHNFRYVGLIATAFPEAKIVHVKRSPAATCWANYKTYFEADALGYCFSLDDILDYYRCYQDIMSFWSKSLKNRIYDIDYDLLSVNQEDETRRLINYLDLEWESRCLNPQNNKRAINTASSFQVRERVYQGSSEFWKNYKPFLNGKLDHLEN